jgi:3-methyladenine DNA glycosylase AlkD
MLADEDDLVRKGVGWLLKEAYAATPNEVVSFLQERSAQASRLVLRIAAEKMTPAHRKAVFLSAFICVHLRPFLF